MVGGLDISATLPVSHVDVYCGVDFDVISFDLVYEMNELCVVTAFQISHLILISLQKTKGRSKSVMREALAQGSQTLRLKVGQGTA